MIHASLKAQYRTALDKVERAQKRLELAKPADDLDALTRDFDDALEGSELARAALGPFERAERVLADKALLNDGQTPVRVLREEATYRPDVADVTFLGDLVLRQTGDVEARQRLERNRLEAIAHFGYTQRDMSSTLTAGGDFLPPLYLGNLAVSPNIAGRPFADAVPKLPLPPEGTSISIPSFASGVAVETRLDGGTVQETDGVTATITHDVNEIAGQVDVGRQLVMRSSPGFDVMVIQTLKRRYDAKLDTQLISGTGTAPQHRGIRVVVGANAVTYTDATPTSAELYPKIFDAAQQIATNRLEVFGDTVLLHPRRSAWLAKELSTSFPLFQYGSLNQAGGTQSGGFARDLSGLNFILDPNIPTTLGASTNEDEIYVLAIEDFILMEGPLMVKVWDGVGSGEGEIRFQAFAFSAFLSKRYPKSISVISGSGLSSPQF